MKERAIPWDPIPHEYNRLSIVNVSALNEPPTPQEDGIAVTVSSSPVGQWDTEYTWRLFFSHCYAYRNRGVGNWPDALPLTWPPERGRGWAVDGGMVALWEVVDSRFVRETVSPTSRDSAHHYVLMSHDVAFEVVVQGVRVEDLGVLATEENKAAGTNTNGDLAQGSDASPASLPYVPNTTLWGGRCVESRSAGAAGEQLDGGDLEPGQTLRIYYSHANNMDPCDDCKANMQWLADKNHGPVIAYANSGNYFAFAPGGNWRRPKYGQWKRKDAE